MGAAEPPGGAYLAGSDVTGPGRSPERAGPGEVTCPAAIPVETGRAGSRGGDGMFSSPRGRGRAARGEDGMCRARAGRAGGLRARQPRASEETSGDAQVKSKKLLEARAGGAKPGAGPVLEVGPGGILGHFRAREAGSRRARRGWGRGWGSLSEAGRGSRPAAASDHTREEARAPAAGPEAAVPRVGAPPRAPPPRRFPLARSDLWT